MLIEKKKINKPIKRSTVEVNTDILKYLQAICLEHNYKMKSLVNTALTLGIQEIEREIKDETGRRKHKSDASHEDDN